MTITLLYAGLLGLWFFVLSLRVIQGRRGGISLGDGGDPAMLRLMRGQANFAEYVPLTLLLIALLESQGLAAWVIHWLGGGLLVARLLHGWAFCFSDYFPPGRVGGTVLTFAVLLTASGLALWQALAG